MYQAKAPGTGSLVQAEERMYKAQSIQSVQWGEREWAIWGRGAPHHHASEAQQWQPLWKGEASPCPCSLSPANFSQNPQR